MLHGIHNVTSNQDQMVRYQLIGLVREFISVTNSVGRIKRPNMIIRAIAPSENAADRMKHFREKWRSPNILSKSSCVPSGSAPSFRTSNVRSHLDKASLARWDAKRSPNSKTPRTDPATRTGTLPVPNSWIMSVRKLTCGVPVSRTNLAWYASWRCY